MASGETMAATTVSLATEPLADIGQLTALAVGEPEMAADLSTRNAVLRGEVLVSEEDLLINGAGDVGDEVFPGHGSVANLLTLGSE